MTTPFITTFTVDNAHSGDIYAVATCPQYTAAASGDGIISLWDNKSPSETFNALNQTPVPAGIHHMSLEETGSNLAAVAFDGSIHAWDLKSQTPLALENINKQVRGAWCCAIAGSTAVVGTLQGSIHVFNVTTDEMITELTEPAASTDIRRLPCLSVDISSDVKYVASAYETGKVRIFSIETGRIAYTLPSHISRPRSLKFNRQSTVLAVTGNESIALYTLVGGSYLGSLLGHEAYVYDIAFDATGERILSVAGDGKTKVWSVERKEAVFTVVDSKSPIFSCAWIPERTNIIAGAPAGFVTGGVDRTLRWYREASGSANDF